MRRSEEVEVPSTEVAVETSARTAGGQVSLSICFVLPFQSSLLFLFF